MPKGKYPERPLAEQYDHLTGEQKSKLFAEMREKLRKQNEAAAAAGRAANKAAFERMRDEKRKK